MSWLAMRPSPFFSAAEAVFLPLTDPEAITRTMLRPVASSLPLGFLAFGTGSVLLTALELHWVPVAQGSTLMVIVLAFVAPLEALAGLFAFLARDSGAATALSMLGAAWAATAALENLPTQGTETIADHDQALVEQLIGLLDHSGYRFVSPTDPGQRAATVVISAADPRDNQAIYQRLTGAGIDTALRAGNIRLSPHLYNTPGQIQYAAAILADATTTPRTGNRRA
jgi:GPR1/FUN34/yaaH family